LIFIREHYTHYLRSLKQDEKITKIEILESTGNRLLTHESTTLTKGYSLGKVSKKSTAYRFKNRYPKKKNGKKGGKKDWRKNRSHRLRIRGV
jgi:hypothetical protein